MTTYFVSRHPGAQQWAAEEGFAVDALITHLNLDVIQSGDVVIGTLPIHLAAQVCQRGGRYFNLSLELPPEWRGRELAAADLRRFGARLEEYRVTSA